MREEDTTAPTPLVYDIRTDDAARIGCVQFGVDAHKLRSIYRFVSAAAMGLHMAWIARMLASVMYHANVGHGLLGIGIATMSVLQMLLIAAAAHLDAPWRVFSETTLIDGHDGIGTAWVMRMFCMPGIGALVRNYAAFALFAPPMFAVGVTIPCVLLAALGMYHTLLLAVTAWLYAGGSALTYWAWKYGGIVYPRDEVLMRGRPAR